MGLADKKCYPFTHYIDDLTKPEVNDGLTFRERLIIALAGNPYYVINKKSDLGESYFLSDDQLDDNANQLIQQADAIIKELESGKQLNSDEIFSATMSLIKEYEEYCKNNKEAFDYIKFKDFVNNAR